MDYALGIDGGGTKSHLALFDMEGNLVDFGKWGSLNHEGMNGSFEQLRSELGNFIFDILNKNKIKIDNITSSVFGMAGVDTEPQHKIISDIISGLGFKNFSLSNDAFLGIPAGSPSCYGICAINGTGCTIVGVNSKGKMFQIGGVGYISGDFGGGGMFGRLVISTVYGEFFRKGEPTRMTPLLMEKLGIKSKYDFVEKIYKMFEERTLDLRDLTKLLFEAAKNNDKVSLDILSESGKNYADGISAMIEELEFDKNNDDDLYIVFAGSIFSKGEHPKIIDTIKERLAAGNPLLKFKFNILKIPPVAGAAFWAFNNLNINDKNKYYDKIRSQLENIN
ncbi:MAG: hypothetical protein FWC21_01260 [Treponema sp.]|nr:hypothetical protein [Treponema sp.]